MLREMNVCGVMDLETQADGFLQSVADAFAMNEQELRAARCADARAESTASEDGSPEELTSRPKAGEVWLVTGASGAGKSRWLGRSLARWIVRSTMDDCDERFVVVDESVIPDGPVVGGFGDRAMESTLRLLGAIGLTEPSVLFRAPDRLSVGQRHRLAIAQGIARIERADEPGCLVVDEFAAVLDRVTAAVLARGVRRLIDADEKRRSAVLVTSHDDLVRALDPDVWIVCDFGKTTIRRFARSKATRDVMHPHARDEVNIRSREAMSIHPRDATSMRSRDATSTGSRDARSAGSRDARKAIA